MPKVWCAEIECEHNKGNRCKAKEINLSAVRIYAAHDGIRPVRFCRTHQMSESGKKRFEALTLLGEEGADHE